MPPAQTVIRQNYVVEILTPTPRRWTPFPGLTGQRGSLVVGANTYSTHRIDVPEFTEDDSQSPLTITLIIGNARNEANDLVTNAANRRAVITIKRLKFDANWAITETVDWFIGKTGQPAFKGETVTIECHADMGRVGPSPSIESRNLMLSHRPPTGGVSSEWTGGAT